MEKFLQLLLIVVSLFFFFIAFIAPFMLYGLSFIDMFIVPLKEKLLPRWYKIFPPVIHPAIPNTLSKHVSYYKNLSRDNKIKFQQRLHYFLKTKSIIGKGGLFLTDEMKILICASAVQITFGLKYFSLRYFYRIYVYPDSYHYQNSLVKFRGHVSHRGVIHLSWHHFEKGYLFPEDGINLGLHEMAHALKLHALEEEVDFEFYDNLEILKKHAREAAENRASASFFDFSQNSIDEFWAQLVEKFFETPIPFKAEFPDLYDAMRRLLNQDTLNPLDPVIRKD